MKEKKMQTWRRTGAALLAATLFATSVQPFPVLARALTGPEGTTETPIVSLDFNSVTGTGLTNSKFTDSNASEALAVTDDGYKLESRAADYYLDLTGDKWLSVTKADGTPLLTGKDEVTIMYDSYIDGDGKWAFYADSDGELNTESTLNYLGIIEGWNETAEKYAGGRPETDPTSMIVNMSGILQKQWKRMAVVVTATTVTVYQNGKVAGTATNENGAALSSILGNASIFQIGRGNWGTNGEYYNGYIDNFQVYAGALTAEQVAGTATETMPELLADFHFDSVETGENETVTFAGGNAKAVVGAGNAADIIKPRRIPSGKALDLRGSKKTLYVTKEDGTPILKDCETATIVFDSYLENGFAGNQWPFYAEKDIYAQDFGNQNYIAADENGGSTDIIRYADDSTGKADNDVRTGVAPVLNEWKNVAVVYDTGSTSLYINGELVKSTTGENIATIKDILGENGGVFQIGRANWGDGEFYNGMLDNFQVYAGALSADEVAKVYENPESATVARKIADFSFDDEETGFEGAGAVARPFLTYDTDGDGTTELYFAELNKTYLNLLQNGGSPLKGAEEITISYDSRPYIDQLNAKWPFFAAESADVQEYMKEKYIGIQNLVGAATLEVHYWNNEASGFRLPAISADMKDYQSDWRHVDLVIDKEKTTLYVNGRKQGQIRSYYPLSEILGEDGGVAQIGKANWGSGEYYGGYIDNFQIYNKAIHPGVKEVRVKPADGAVVDETGRIKVLAGHLREELDVTAVLTDGTEIPLGPTDYDVRNYMSQNGNQTVKIHYNGHDQSQNIYVYNRVNSKQDQVLDENGNKMFAIHSTWYDYLTDAEREGKGNYHSNSYVMSDADGNHIDPHSAADADKEIVSSEAEYVQFNHAIDNYWRNNIRLDVDGDGEKGLDNRFFPIYWGDFYSLDEVYRGYDENPDNDTNRVHYQYQPGEGASFRKYGENFYGAVWGYNSHQFCKAAAQGIFDTELGKNASGEPVITIGKNITPYFDEAEGALKGDAHGDVYMNVYEDVLMPFRAVPDENGIPYYMFESGDQHGETIYISDDEENTVKYKSDNPCTDARYGTGDAGLDGYSFMPFNDTCDKNTANCGFATKMDFTFYSTYDGKLPSKTNAGERIPIIFEFKGDDEFMLYVDGKLAIDIGGSHGQCDGTVNFAEQTVTISGVREIQTYGQSEEWSPNDVAGLYGGADKPSKIQSVTKTFAELGLDFSDPSVEHQAVIYYTERGKLEGNLKLRFNFPQENSIIIRKDVSTENVNESLQDQMKEVVANEDFTLEVQSDYKNKENRLEPVSGEAVAYYDGLKYTQGTILDGRVSLKDGYSVVLPERSATADNPIGFVDEEGTRFSIKEDVNLDKYIPAWKFWDTEENLMGEGRNSVVVDDNYSHHPDGQANMPDRFRLYNLNRKEITDESGVARVNLKAEYTNIVKTGDISIKKEMYGSAAQGDIFKFKLTLSNLFDSRGKAFTYEGKYILLATDGVTFLGEKDTVDGYIELEAGQTAVIKGIPVLTDYMFQEDLDAGTYEGKEYQVVGNNYVEGVVAADVCTESVISNMPKSATAFFAWKDHETTLPIGEIRNLCDASGNDVVDYDNDECKAVKIDGGIQFTGKVLGNVLVYYKDLAGQTASATIHVYEPENKAYVLDYGLPVDLNQAGDSSFGISQKMLTDGTGSYTTVTGVKPELASVRAARIFGGVRAYEDSADNWGNYSTTEAVTTGKSKLQPNDVKTDQAKLLYTPTQFMDSADVYDYRVDVKDREGINLTDDELTAEHGVRMKGTLTVVPADVVYYEDDFEAISVTGTNETEGKREDLNQSNDQEGVYGYDDAYANGKTDSAAGINKDLLVHYDFSRLRDAVSGTAIPDISGNNNHAAIKGNGAAASGDVLTLPGGAAGSDAAYVELPKGLTDNKDAVTISVWMKNETGAGNYAGMFIGNDTNKYWIFNPKNPADLGGRFKSVVTIDSWGNEKGTRHGDGPVTDSNWALYTTVIDGDTLSTYYNGTLIETETTGISLAALGTNLAAYIGRAAYDDIFYKGGVRDVRIYSSALDAAGVKELYDKTKLDGNLIVHYDFSKVQKDENGIVADQTVIPDVSGNRNSATLYKGNSAENTNATVTGDILTFAGTTVGDAPYIQLPDSLNTGKEAMTVSMWLGSQRRDWVNVAWYAGQGKERYWMLNPRTDTDIIRNFVTKSGSFGEQNVAHDASKYTIDGSLTLYTLVMENGKLSTYINGQLAGSNDATGIGLADLTDTCKMYIGRSGYSGDFYQGDIRDVRIYDRTLTPEEIKGLFNGTEDVSSEPTLDSAGSSTRLVADSGAVRGTMTFTFKGRGFDLIGRSNTDTAGLSVVIRDETGKLVKSQIVDTSYANGKLYQLPVISIKDLEYGTYTVTLKAMKTQNRADSTLNNDSVYIDAVRIYDPAGTKEETDTKGEVSKYYLENEYKADKPEVRELLLGSVKFENLDAILKNSEKLEEEGELPNTTTTSAKSSASLVTFDEDLGTAIYHAGSAQVENPDTSAGINSNQTLEKILKRGPNNEVYLAKGNAVAFRALPVTEIPASERTLQIEAKKVADDQRGGAEISVLTDHKDAQGAYDTQTMELTTYTPMYYDIDLSKCKRYSGGSYLVVLASTGDSMVSLTNLKVKGYTFMELTEDKFSDVSVMTEDTYRMMSVMYTGDVPKEDDAPKPGDDSKPGDDPKPGDDEIIKELPFTDVQSGSWYEPYVRYVYEKGIMTGLNETHFGPEQTICRAQFAVMLYRMAGNPKTEFKNTFKDVADGQFYTDAVMWASGEDTGIITGYTDGPKKGCFGPGDAITREQIAVMLYRYVQDSEDQVKASPDLSQFEDSEQISAFAEDAVTWAVAEKLIQGDNGRINPQGNTNRAECAAMIQRFLER